MRVANLSLQFLLAAMLLPATLCAPQSSSSSNPADDPERRQAMELFDQHKMKEAAALLEKLAQKYPNDVVIHERLGTALLSRAEMQTDPEKRKADRRQAHQELLKAKELGDNSDLLRALLDAGEDDKKFSTSADVDAAMQKGEAEFSEGNYEAAIKQYTRALELDPKLYVAAVDMGDCYFRLKQWDEASKWFAQAIRIDPAPEVAYRYWGDSLMAEGKIKDARTKFIEGLIANPYKQTSWSGLNNWIKGNHLQYRQIFFKLPQAPATNGKGGQTITIDPATLEQKDSGGAAWMMYPMERALWQSKKFAEQFPQEKSYRHTVKEETSALSLVVSSFDEMKKNGSAKKPDPSLVLLSQINADGMLEPFVLLIHPDKDIANEYLPYLAANRDKLISFVDKYVLPQAP